MDLLLFFGLLTAAHMIIYMLKLFLKSCMLVDTYNSILRSAGISIDFLRLRWHTRPFNRMRSTNEMTKCVRGFFNTSFTLGVVVCFLLLPLGIILLFITIFGGINGQNNKYGGDENARPNIQMEILLPGINLPLEELGYYLIALLVSTVVHEWGHAFAAILEDVPVTGFGIQLYFCIPLAYTELSADHLNALKWFRKLRIMCAGIWHNFVFGAFCYLLLSTFNFMAAPLYDVNKGVIVTAVDADSPLRHDRGIFEGNIITKINDCTVFNNDNWYHCLLKALRSKTGYCVTSDFINLNDESIEISHHSPDGSTLRCCDEKNEKVCCFEYVTDISDTSPIEIPQHVCLDVRHTLESASNYCISGRCDANGFCLRPLLRNLTTICNIKRTDQTYTKLRNIIYIGNPIRDIAKTVQISNFIPKRNWLSASWADIYVLFLKYNVVFSFGLALVNVIPCFGFDGYHITSTIINGFLVNRVTERPKRDVISLIIAGVGTLLFGLAFFKVLLLSLSRNFF